MQTCLDKGVAIQNCSWEAIDKYEKEIPKIMAEFKKTLPKETYQKLALSQKKWEEFFKLDIKPYDDFTFYKQGTMYLTVFTAYILNDITNRIDNLLNIFAAYIAI